MKTFQVTLRGFDGGSSDTDHLILWIAADTETQVLQHLNGNGIEYDSVEEIEIDPEDTAVDYSLSTASRGRLLK